MTNDKMKGKVKETVGAGKERVGRATGNEKMEGEGTVEKGEGKVQKNIGRAKETVKKAVS
jgi:uncharacterized protein YjbJ (UPF0337 family)